MWELSSNVVSELEIWLWETSSELDEIPMPAAAASVADPSKSSLPAWLLVLLLLFREQF